MPETNEDANERFTQRRLSFNDIADLYDRARPSYPEQLFNDLMSIGHLTPAISVLEIGCGTGKASVPLAKRVSRLVCVEPGENLATRARYNLRDFPSAEVITSTFETWKAQERFDLVFAASSWHWLDPKTRYEKVASFLKQKGQLAIVTSSHVFPEGFDPLFIEIQTLYDAIGESRSKDRQHTPLPTPEEIPDARDDIERSNVFNDIRVKRYVWTVDYSAQEYVDVLDTYSDHRVMDPTKRVSLYNEIKRRINLRPNGAIRKHYLTILNLAYLA
jgi:SAM-dependent methyltransferase